MASMVKQLTHLAVNQTLAGATPVTRPKLNSVASQLEAF